MINNLTQDRIRDIHHMFYYFSGRKTTLEEELKQAEEVDVTEEIDSNSNGNRHLLMKAVYDFGQNFTGHGFFYIPVEESNIDDILNLVFASLHPKGYVRHFEELVSKVGDEQVEDLPAVVQNCLGTLVNDLNGKSETVKLEESEITISYKKEKETDPIDDKLRFSIGVGGWRLMPKDDEGYSRLIVEVNLPQDSRNNLNEIENAVYEHLEGLMQFTYERSGLLERFPILKRYVQKDEIAIDVLPETHLDRSKIAPNLPGNLYFGISFKGFFDLFKLSDLDSELSWRWPATGEGDEEEKESLTKPVSKEYLFDVCSRAYLRIAGYREGKTNDFAHVLPKVVCDQVETIFRRAYPKAVAALEREIEEKEEDGYWKVREYCRLASLHVLSNLDKAYECLTKAVQLGQEHDKKFVEWDGGFKTIK